MGTALGQRTLARPGATLRGVGLHCGETLTLRILPAGEGEGITFVRTDTDPPARVRSVAGKVTDTMLATTLRDGDASVSTIEHLLCALCLCGVDNATVEVGGPEIPIMDGSARPFVMYLLDTGLVEQGRGKSFIKVKKRVEVGAGDGDGRRASFEPSDAPSWHVSIDFDHPVIRQTAQECSFTMGDHRVAMNRIAGARSFGFANELDLMRERDRALGGSLDNAVVLNGSKVLNEGGLRQDDEFVAHKLLDVLGDCYVEGRLVIGRYDATRPGHGINNELMRALVTDESAWEEVDARDVPPQDLPDFGPLSLGG